MLKAADRLCPEVEGLFKSAHADKLGDTPPEGLDLLPVYMMLMAFALENLAKGILIAREPDRVKEAILKRWEGDGHDLNELAEAAKLSLSSDEKRLLLNLSIHAVWMGRYPFRSDLRSVYHGQQREAVSHHWASRRTPI